MLCKNKLTSSPGMLWCVQKVSSVCYFLDQVSCHFLARYLMLYFTHCDCSTPGDGMPRKTAAVNVLNWQKMKSQLKYNLNSN